MAYEQELQPLLLWVQSHPGLTVGKLEKSIQAVPWPKQDNAGNWIPPLEGTRASPEVPGTTEIAWKLRYLELAGLVRQESGRWYA